MNKSEASELLNLSTNATKTEISSAYKKLFSDYQIRLSNAPTPHLKTLYQNNLKKLEDAMKVLLPEGLGGGLEDLPSDTPILNHEIKTNNNANTVVKTLSETPKNTQQKEKNKAEKNKAEKKPSNNLIKIMGFVSILSVAISVFIIIQYSSKNDIKVNDFTKINNELTETKDKLNKLQANFASITDNGKMKIINKYPSTMRISWFSVTYRDKDGNIKKFDSIEDGHVLDKSSNIYTYPNFTIKSGQTIELKHIVGNDIVWDGSVLTYAFAMVDINDPYAPIDMFSGIWNDKAVDGKLHINKPKHSH
jgi:hypothetical protein